MRALGCDKGPRGATALKALKALWDGDKAAEHLAFLKPKMVISADFG